MPVGVIGRPVGPGRPRTRAARPLAPRTPVAVWSASGSPTTSVGGSRTSRPPARWPGTRVWPSCRTAASTRRPPTWPTACACSARPGSGTASAVGDPASSSCWPAAGGVEMCPTSYPPFGIMPTLAACRCAAVGAGVPVALGADDPLLFGGDARRPVRAVTGTCSGSTTAELAALARHSLDAGRHLLSGYLVHQVVLRILVIGGSGLVGRPTASRLVRRGHTVAVLTRSGAGGPARNRGVRRRRDDPGEGVHDLRWRLSTSSSTAETWSPVQAQGRGRLLHHDDPPAGGARKGGGGDGTTWSSAASVSEQLGARTSLARWRRSARRWTVRCPRRCCRSTQFHEFAGQVLGQLRVGRWSFVPEALLQQIAAAQVGVALAEVCRGRAEGRVGDIAGPRRERLTDMARRGGRPPRRAARVVGLDSSHKLARHARRR